MTDTETRTASGSPFWRFSLQFYRQPSVADACIALQEQSGVDVNLLLFLLWQATQQRSFSPNEVAALEARIGPWREATVVPLRAVRRALKAPPTLVAPATAEAFRTRIKAVELEAERLQQEAMYELARGNAAPGSAAGSSADAARTSLKSYATMRGVAFAKPAVETLLAAFTTLHGRGE